MRRIAEFQHVSSAVYGSDPSDIPLPRRATRGSAGYDFYAPEAFSLEVGQSIKIPTGIRVKMDEGWVLFMLPKSGLGYKYRLMLDNTVGVIDSDYYYSDNEGQMIVKLTNHGDTTLEIKKHAAFCQAVFLPYGITVDDDADGIRNGGFGSTAE